jgi:hypothetical protein
MEFSPPAVRFLLLNSHKHLKWNSHAGGENSIQRRARSVEWPVPITKEFIIGISLAIKVIAGANSCNGLLFKNWLWLAAILFKEIPKEGPCCPDKIHTIEDDLKEVYLNV